DGIRRGALLPLPHLRDDRRDDLHQPLPQGARGMSMSTLAQPIGMNADALRQQRAHRRRKRLTRALRYAVVLIALVWVLFPIYWIVSTSFKLPAELLRNPPVWIPQEPSTAHYRTIMEEKGRV